MTRIALALVVAAGPAAAVPLNLDTLDVVYATGDVVPGLPGVRFADSTSTSFGRSFVALAANDAGDVAAGFSTDSPSAAPGFRDGGVVSTSRGLLGRVGDPVAGSFAGTYLGFGDIDIGAGGEVVADALVRDAPNAIVSSDRGQLVTAGDAVPGVADATFRSFSEPKVAADGTLAFVGFIEGPGVADDGGEGVFQQPGGVVARTGEPTPAVPGTEPTSFGFNRIEQAEGGFFVYDADLRLEGDPNISGRDALLASTPAVVVRQGDLAPGFGGTGTIFSTSGRSFAVAETGEVVFTALVDDTTSNSIFLETAVFSTASGLVVREGGPFPGLPGAIYRTVGAIDVSNAGEVLFVGTTGEIGEGDRAYVSSDRGLLFSAGDAVDLGARGTFTLEGIRDAQFIGDGALAAILDFEGGDEAVVRLDLTGPVPIPLPAGLPLLGAALALLACRRRR